MKKMQYDELRKFIDSKIKEIDEAKENHPYSEHEFPNGARYSLVMVRNYISENQAADERKGDESEE